MTNRSVKDCRVGRKKCALLAMTNLIGFVGNGAISGTKRLKDEMRGDTAQKIVAKNEKRPFSK